MTEIAGTQFHNKKELAQMLQTADLRLQILETALRQVAEQPSDDPAALRQIATIALQKAGEAQPIA